MNRTTRVTAIASSFVLTAIASTALLAQHDAPGNSGSTDVRRGYLAAPPGSQTLNVAIEPESMQLFSNANFKGKEAVLLGKGTATTPPGQPHTLPNDLADEMSSIRWNLPAGVVVVFYEDARMKGEQMVLWGSGQMSDLTTFDFNDKASRWAWFDVGGGSASAQHQSAALPPSGSEALTTALPDNSIQLYKDKNFRDDMKQVSPVTAAKAGEPQKITGGLDDALTSLSWNLPPGVVVMLYEDADGRKDRIAIWGKGQLSDLDLWDFNDKVSRWSWAYVGSPGKGE